MKNDPPTIEGLRVAQKGGLALLSFPDFAPDKAVKHLVSTRLGGVSRGGHRSLNLGTQVGDEPLRVSENRELFRLASGYPKTRLVQPKQVHGDTVLKVGPEDLNALPVAGPWKEGDALITREKNVTLMILVADCLPVLFYDPVQSAIGLAHAGWRGTVSHVAAKTLLAMGEAFGTQPADVKAALGPCIGPCCYEVGEDVKGQFDEVFPWSSEVFQKSFDGRHKLDLASANARQLLELGVAEGNLTRSKLCTVEHPEWFYSHRAEGSGGEATGRFGVFLMLED